MPDRGRECERYIFPTANTTERGDLILEKLVIHGGNRLSGEVEISGAKNAVVAILPAAILVSGKCRIVKAAVKYIKIPSFLKK